MNSTTTKNLTELYEVLKKLVGFHRELLDTVRLEREAIVTANLQAIQTATHTKEGILQEVARLETIRINNTAELALEFKKPLKDLTLAQIAIEIQGEDLKKADQFRSALNALTLLIQRIKEQSQYNKELIEKSLGHIQEMKTNVLGESVPKSSTYSAQGKKVQGEANSRFISKEA